MGKNKLICSALHLSNVSKNFISIEKQQSRDTSVENKFVQMISGRAAKQL